MAWPVVTMSNADFGMMVAFVTGSIPEFKNILIHLVYGDGKTMSVVNIKRQCQTHQVNHIADDAARTGVERNKRVGHPERNTSPLIRPELGQLAIDARLTLVERCRRHVEWLPHPLLQEFHVCHTRVLRHDV